MAEKFASILDKPVEEIEAPKPLPVGTYVAVVQGPPEHGKSAKKETPFVRFTYKILQAGEDVDTEELEAFGELGEKTMKDTYYLTDEAGYRLKDTLANMGLELKDGQTMRALLDETPGCQLGIYVKHEASDDGQKVYANIGSTIKLT